MLQYTLVENLLTPAPDDYVAQPVNVRSYTKDEILDRIKKRYTGLTPAQISAAIDEFSYEVEMITEEGSTVNTPLMSTLWSIPGAVNSATEYLDPQKNPPKLNINPGTTLRAAARRVKLEKVIVAEPIPHILEVKDVTSDTVNDLITAGGVVQLRGSRLKFLANEENNGIFVINGQTAEERKFVTIVENKPARLIAVLPTDIPQGEYFIEVRTTFSTGKKPTKALKTGRYNKVLTVA
jgi:hypothetical protein